MLFAARERQKTQRDQRRGWRLGRSLHEFSGRPGSGNRRWRQDVDRMQGFGRQRLGIERLGTERLGVLVSVLLATCVAVGGAAGGSCCRHRRGRYGFRGLRHRGGLGYGRGHSRGVVVGRLGLRLRVPMLGEDRHGAFQLGVDISGLRILRGLRSRSVRARTPEEARREWLATDRDPCLRYEAGKRFLQPERVGMTFQRATLDDDGVPRSTTTHRA